MDKISKQEEKILKAAQIVFFRVGFEGAKTQEIADKAKVNKALLHYYFRNKESLFEKVFEIAFSKFCQPFQALNSSEENFMRSLDRFIADMLVLVKGKPELIIFIVNVMKHQPELLRDKQIDQIDIQKFLDRLKLGSEQGFVRTANPETAWLSILGILFGAASAPIFADSQIHNLKQAKEAYFEEIPKQIKGVLIGF